MASGFPPNLGAHPYIHPSIIRTRAYNQVLLVGVLNISREGLPPPYLLPEQCPLVRLSVAFGAICSSIFFHLQLLHSASSSWIRQHCSDHLYYVICIYYRWMCRRVSIGGRHHSPPPKPPITIVSIIDTQPGRKQDLHPIHYGRWRSW